MPEYGASTASYMPYCLCLVHCALCTVQALPGGIPLPNRGNQGECQVMVKGCCSVGAMVTGNVIKTVTVMIEQTALPGSAWARQAR